MSLSDAVCVIPASCFDAMLSKGCHRENLRSSIGQNDVPMVQTLTFMFAVLIVVFNIINDVLIGFLDPRIRYD